MTESTRHFPEGIRHFLSFPMQTLRSRSRSQGPNLVMHGKALSQSMCVPNIKDIPSLVWDFWTFSKPKRRFWNLDADSEVKVKVTGIKILTCMVRPCPKACVCQILKVYLNGSYDQFSKPKRRFWNPNADSVIKVKVTEVMCVPNIKVISQLVWDLRTIFRNLNADF